MATRSVNIELKAKVGEYVTGTEAAKKATAGLKNETQQVDQNLKKIPPDAAKAAAALKLFGIEGDAAGQKIALAGRKGDSAFKSVEEQLKKARLEVGRLRGEFNRTGDASLIGAIIRAQREVKTLAQLTSQLGIGAGVRAGGLAMPISGLGPWLATLAPALAAATLGALAISGGIIASALPLTGIATGIFAQHNNPLVAKPAARAASTLGADIKYATSPLAGPAGQAITALAASLSKSIRATRGDFETLIPYLRMFAGYLGVAAEKFMPKFGEALRNSEPVFAILARDLPVLADAAGDFFLQISKGSKGGAEALDMFIGMIAQLLRGLGYIIRGAENAFDAITQFLDKTLSLLIDVNKAMHIPTGPLELARTQVRKLGADWEAAKGAGFSFAGSIDDTNAALANQAEELKKTTDRWNEYFNRSMDLDEAVLAQKQSIRDLSDSLKENGRHWDINTEAGRNNREALLKSIKTANDLRTANLESGMSQAEADKIYNTQLHKLEAIAKAAGLAKTELDRLASRYEVNIDVKIHQMGRVNDALAIANRYRYGGIQAAATGAIIPESRGPLVKFVEPGTGGEGFIPRRGITHARAGALLGEMAGWHGFGLTDGGRWTSGGGMGGGMAPVNLTVNLMAPDGKTLQKVLIRNALNANVPQSVIQAAYPG